LPDCSLFPHLSWSFKPPHLQLSTILCLTEMYQPTRRGASVPATEPEDGSRTLPAYAIVALALSALFCGVILIICLYRAFVHIRKRLATESRAVSSGDERSHFTALPLRLLRRKDTHKSAHVEAQAIVDTEMSGSVWKINPFMVKEDVYHPSGKDYQWEIVDHPSQNPSKPPVLRTRDGFPTLPSYKEGFGLPDA